MPLLDLDKITAGLSASWAGLLRDWDRSLRSGNHPETTRYNYLLAAAQLARFLGEHSPDPDADSAAEDPAEVRKGHVEAFQAWMIDTRSAATALNKHKGLQQFFRWLMVDEEEIDRSPMDRVRQPKIRKKLIPVIGDEETAKVLGTCRGTSFVQLRDEAIIRLYYNTGARLSEVGNMQVDDLDLSTESARLAGKEWDVTLRIAEEFAAVAYNELADGSPGRRPGNHRRHRASRTLAGRDAAAVGRTTPRQARAGLGQCRRRLQADPAVHLPVRRATGRPAAQLLCWAGPGPIRSSPWPSPPSRSRKAAKPGAANTADDTNPARPTWCSPIRRASSQALFFGVRYL